MPRLDDVYLCPICNEVYASEDEARECCEPECEPGFICDCGDAFLDGDEFQRHASRCPEIKPSCLSCNNFEAGAKKWHVPCERAQFSDDMTPCEEYRRIK